jgi:hypothetical protein
MFFPNQADFNLTDAFLFGGSFAAAEVMPMSFEPPMAIGYGRMPWRASSRFSRPTLRNLSIGEVQLQQQRQLHEQRPQPGSSRAFQLAQTVAQAAAQAAALALSDPDMDDLTFSETIAAALNGVPPPQVHS